MTDGRFAAERRSGSSLAGATTRTRRAWPSPAPSASRTATNALVCGSSVMPKLVDDADRVVAELGGQRGAERDPAHLARQLLLVGARVRAEHDAAAAVVRRGARALARAAGALLAVRLAATAADLAAGLRVVRAGPAAGELGDDGLVEDGLVHRRGEQRLGEVDAPDGRAGSVVEVGLRHGQAFRTKVSAPGAPGTEPRTRIRFRSESTRTTRSFLIVTRTWPMWPPIFMPR